jgi:UDP-glucose 6-dehydrogenase
MKHLIIGAGVIGQATGKWLVVNKHEVIFNDINQQIVDKLNKQDYCAVNNLDNITEKPDIVGNQPVFHNLSLS